MSDLEHNNRVSRVSLKNVRAGGVADVLEVDISSTTKFIH